MGEVISIKRTKAPYVQEKKYKVTLTALSLALEYFAKEGDEVFVKEARVGVARHTEDFVCFISKEVHDKVMKSLPVEKAVAEILYAQ